MPPMGTWCAAVKVVTAAVSLLTRGEVEVVVVGADAVRVWPGPEVRLLCVGRCLDSGALEALRALRERQRRSLWVGGCPAAREGVVE